MKEIIETMNTIENTWLDNSGGLTMAAIDELSFGSSLLNDWDKGISRNFTWEEMIDLSSTSQEMVDKYYKAFLRKFCNTALQNLVVGLPCNVSVTSLYSFLKEKDFLEFKLSKPISTCLWANDEIDYSTWNEGGCISCY